MIELSIIMLNTPTFIGITHTSLRSIKKPLLEFSDFCKKEINPTRTLKREIHTEPIKAMLRYMLTHKGNNSQYKIDSIFEQLQFEKAHSLQDNYTK